MLGHGSKIPANSSVQDPGEADDIDEDDDPSEPRTRRWLPRSIRDEIYNYFREPIAELKSPSSAMCRQYVHEHSSELEWTRVKAIVNSRIQGCRTKQLLIDSGNVIISLSLALGAT